MREFFRQLSNERPRTYGAVLLSVGLMALGVCQLLRESGRISFMLILVTPIALVFGTQALALGTTADQLKEDRVTSGVLLLVSLAGSAALFFLSAR